MGTEKTIRVEVECKQTVTYSQTIEVTEAEYELLMEADGMAVSATDHGDDKLVYNILDGKLDYGDVSDSNLTLDIYNVRKVE